MKRPQATVVHLLCLFLWACSANPKRAPETSFGFRHGFFLLPPPPTQTRTQLQDLLSAPLMDSSLILETAAALEASTRRQLAARRQQFADDFCARPQDRRRAFLVSGQAALERQNQIRSATARRYDRTFDLLLPQVVSPATVQQLAGPLRLVRTLRKERADITRSAWTHLFERLKEDPEQLCSQRSAMPPLPREALFAPYYLAWQRLLGPLPHLTRGRLITALHPGKNDR